MVFTTFTGSISIPMNIQGFMTGEGKHCTESEGAGMTEIDANLASDCDCFVSVATFQGYERAGSTARN